MKKRFNSEVSKFTNINKTNNYNLAQINENKKVWRIPMETGPWIETGKQCGTVKQVNEIPALFIFINWISNVNPHIKKHHSFHSQWLHNICLLGSLGLFLSLQFRNVMSITIMTVFVRYLYPYVIFLLIISRQGSDLLYVKWHQNNKDAEMMVQTCKCFPNVSKMSYVRQKLK
jgi:hypothetical protein